MRASIVALAVVVASTVSGCVETTAKRPVDPADLAAAGAWEQEFADAIGDASEYEAEILGDGVIIAAERTEAQAKVRACMADAGYDYRGHDDGTAEMQRSDGGDLPSVDRSDDVLRSCRHRFDRNVSYSFDEYDEAAVQCRLDPLGLWRNG